MKLKTGASLCDELSEMYDAVTNATSPTITVDTNDLRLLFRLVAHRDESLKMTLDRVSELRARINAKNAELRALRK